MRVAAAGALAVMLAGCGGPGTAVPRGGSWVLPDAKQRGALLYVSDFNTNEVFVYDYPTGALVGTLSDFAYPFNQCVDKRGDVWITFAASSYGASSVVEYAHGATTPSTTLSVQGQAVGCSVDPIHGDLAVSSILYGPTQINVFKRAMGTPKVYRVGACGAGISVPGYDDKGNLYVEGFANVAPGVCELPRGGGSLKGPVRLRGFTIGSREGGVMWDGTHLTLSDQEEEGSALVTAMYQVKESPSGALTMTGKTILTSKCGAGLVVLAPFIVGKRNTPANTQQGKAVVGGNAQCGSEFDGWSYPAGGAPVSSLQSPPAQPSGQSVSLLAR